MTIEIVTSDEFIAYIDTSYYMLKFDVYEFAGKSGGHYFGLSKEHGTIIPFDRNLCSVVFSGSYCWKGVWEGRLYFNQDEYWSEDLNDMNEFFSNMLEPRCISIIKARDPEYKYFDA